MEKKNWMTPEVEVLDVSKTELLPLSFNSYDLTFGVNGWFGLGEYRS